MTGGAAVQTQEEADQAATSEPEPVKKIKTLMPVMSEKSGTNGNLNIGKVNNYSDSDDSEEETRVINDIDYEALEDIWLKAGEIDAKDMSYNDKKKKKMKEWRRRREEWSTENGANTSTETDTSDGEWSGDTGESPGKSKASSAEKKRKKSGGRVTPEWRKNYTWKMMTQPADLETEIIDDPPPAMVASPRKPMDYMFPLAGKNTLAGVSPGAAAPKPHTPGGFASAFLNFAGLNTASASPPPASSANNPMIRVDYSKPSEEVSVSKDNDLSKTSSSTSTQNLSSTIEKLKNNLNGAATEAASASPQSGAGRVLSLLLGCGVTAGQVTQLQRGTNTAAVQKLVAKAAQMKQLQSQMSDTHRWVLP